MSDFVSAVVMFVYGLHLMGAGLSLTERATVAEKARRLFARGGSRPGRVMAGFLATAVLQSSSVVSILLVKSVQSGAILLAQACDYLSGINLGTTVTAWIICLLQGRAGESIFSLCLPALLPAAFVLSLSGLRSTAANCLPSERQAGSAAGQPSAPQAGLHAGLGRLLLALVLVFLGLERFSRALSGSGSAGRMLEQVMSRASHPALCLAGGFALTLLLQSSSAGIGLLQLYAAHTAVPLSQALYFVIGQNIGTCVITIISAAGGGRAAAQTAGFHLLFNLTTGGVVCLLFAPAVLLCPALGHTCAGSVRIALLHSLFNLLGICLMYPMTPSYIQWCKDRGYGRRDR